MEKEDLVTPGLKSNKIQISSHSLPDPTWHGSCPPLWPHLMPIPTFHTPHQSPCFLFVQSSILPQQLAFACWCLAHSSLTVSGSFIQAFAQGHLLWETLQGHPIYWSPIAFYLSWHFWHQMCGGFFFPTSTNFPTLQTPTACPAFQFNSDTNYPELSETPQVKGSVPQDCSPTLDANCKSWGSHASDRLAINQGFPQPPPQVP